MSRVGNRPISLPSSVKVDIQEKKIIVEGPKGQEEAPIFSGIDLKVDNNILYIKANPGEQRGKKQKALHGLVRALVNNCIIGTTEGFKKELEIKGVGYRAAQKGEDIQFQLGFSHEVIYKTPSDVSIKIISPTELEISGTNKERVGQISAEIRSLKKPEPYKGKGIRYKGEHIIMKAGKVGKK